MAYIHCAASCCLGRPRPAVQHKQSSAGAQPGLSQRLLQHAGCCRIHNGNVFLAFHSCTNDVGAVGGQGGGTVSWLGLCLPCLRQVTVSQCGSSCLDVSCSRQRLHCKVQHGAGRHALDCRCAGLLGAPPTPGTNPPQSIRLCMDAVPTSSNQNIQIHYNLAADNGPGVDYWGSQHRVTCRV